MGWPRLRRTCWSRRLLDWGVDTIFGIPGDGINGIIEALRTRQDRIRFVQVRHEEAAAFMACAYAKWTGRLGVCLATSGPGGIHLLNGLYDAKLDGAPVLAITGLQYHDLVSTFTQQDVELDKLFIDVAVYNARIMGPAHVENVVELACRTALAYRGVSARHHAGRHAVDAGQRRRRARSATCRGMSRTCMAESAHMPSEDQLARAAAILNAGSKICILAGRGALGAAARAQRRWPSGWARRSPRRCSARGRCPTTAPTAPAGSGLLGTAPSQDALESCDTLLIVGSTFPYIEFYPKPGQARAVQIDLDPQADRPALPGRGGAGGRQRPRAAGAAAAARAARRTAPSSSRRRPGCRTGAALMDERGTRQDVPMKPQVVAHELNRLLADDAIIATDSGTITSWAARHLTHAR